jgi:hypothetical protein
MYSVRRWLGLTRGGGQVERGCFSPANARFGWVRMTVDHSGRVRSMYFPPPSRVKILRQIQMESYVVNSNITCVKLDRPSPSQFTTRLTAMFYPCITLSNSKPHGTCINFIHVRHDLPNMCRVLIFLLNSLVNFEFLFGDRR